MDTGHTVIKQFDNSFDHISDLLVEYVYPDAFSVKLIWRHCQWHERQSKRPLSSMWSKIVISQLLRVKIHKYIYIYHDSLSKKQNRGSRKTTSGCSLNLHYL